MPERVLRKFGASASVDFTLFEIDGINFRTDAVHVSGDTKIRKDASTEVNTVNGFVDETTSYSIIFTAAELSAKRIFIPVVDQGTKIWLDDYLMIETYGHSQAMHPFDLGSDLSDYNETWKFKQIDIQNDGGSALVAKSIGGNGHGIDASGHGTGHGLFSKGGLTGDGLFVQGGETGKGMKIVGGTTSGVGLSINTTDGYAIDASSGGTNPAVFFQGGTNSAGLKLLGNGTVGLDTPEIGTPPVIFDGTVSPSIYAMLTAMSDSSAGADFTASIDSLSIISAQVGGMSTDVNVVSIDGQATSGNNATLNLKQLNIVNNSGSAFIAHSTGSNGHGIDASGNGAGTGIYAEAGATGHGVEIKGGYTSGNGVNISSQGSSEGMVVAGAGSEDAVYFVGGSSGSSVGLRIAGWGYGIYATASGPSGDGFRSQSGQHGHGIYALGGAGGASGHGILAEARDGDYNGICCIGNDSSAGFAAIGGATGNGIEATGGGTGHGVKVTGGSTGHGISISGGTTSGNSIDMTSTSGHGIQIEANGSGKQGMYIQSISSNGMTVVGTTGIRFQGLSGPAIDVNAAGGNALNIVSTDNDGIYIEAGGSNPGFYCQGSGSQAGMEIRGGSSDGRGALIQGGGNSEGVRILSGGTLDPGLYIQGGTHGIHTQGTGAGEGIYAEGGATGHGMELTGNDTSAGLYITGGATGHGIVSRGGDTTGDGINAYAQTGDGAGMRLRGVGTGRDLDATEVLGGGGGGTLNALTLDTVVDGTTLEYAFMLMMARVNGKYLVNDPTGGDIRFFRRDDTTELTRVHVTTAGRTRTF